MQIYIFAQVMGGLAGAALVYANYIHAINIVEGGSDVRTLTTASLFTTFAVGALSPVVVNMFLVLMYMPAGLHDERLRFLLRVSCYCSACITCLCNDGQEEHGTAPRSRSSVPVSGHSRHWSIPRNGNW